MDHNIRSSLVRLGIVVHFYPITLAEESHQNIANNHMNVPFLLGSDDKRLTAQSYQTAAPAACAFWKHSSYKVLCSSVNIWHADGKARAFLLILVDVGKSTAQHKGWNRDWDGARWANGFSSACWIQTPFLIYLHRSAWTCAKDIAGAGLIWHMGAAEA